MASDTSLAGVLSSHVGDRARFLRLKACLKSVAQQSVRLDAFYVVWSAQDLLAAEVEQLFADVAEQLRPTPLHVLRQTKRTSQFFDIKWLYDELISKCQSQDAWLLFTDDDDLWSKDRVKLYRATIGAYAPLGSSQLVTAVCATHKVRPVHRSHVASCPEEVEEDLAAGRAKHCGGVHVEEEFFDFACRSESLGAFLAMCNQETLLHPFCDLRFSRFLQEYYEGGKVIYFPTDKPNSWVYFYATAHRSPDDAEAYEQFAGQDQASTVVRGRAEDRAEALEMCRAFRKGRGDVEPQELAEMTEFVAGLRQNIEAILIRHFPETPLTLGELKRIAVGQIQGQLFAAQLAVKLGRQACERFGVCVA